MRRIKKYNLLHACVLVISIATSISVSAGMVKRKVTPVIRYGTAETTAATRAANQQEDKNSEGKSNIITDKGVYYLSENSKYRQYLWKNADGSTPDYKAYVFEPEVFNGHTVFVDPGHGDNNAPEANQKRKNIILSRMYY